jgi:parallel beta-helix repeat protein
MKSRILHSMICILVAIIVVMTFLLFPIGPMPVANAQSDPIVLNADYQLNSDVAFSGTGFIIEADNITLNLNGHTITGSYSAIPNPEFGIYVNGHTGVTIKNGTVQGFVFGVVLDNANGNTIKGITSNDNYHNGICIFNNSDNNNVKDCTCTGNGSVGIIMTNGSNGNLVMDCTNSGNGTGVSITLGTAPGAIGSDSNTVKRTVCNNNSLGGIFVGDSDYNTIMDNITNGNGIVGITIRFSDYNEIRRNQSSNNAQIGITVGWRPTDPPIPSENNLIVGNELSNNPLWDIRDTTTGSGTAGTANFYRKNTGTTSNPAGLVQ